MTAPEFRTLTPEELAKLSHQERIEYRRQLVQQMLREISNTDAAIAALAKKSEESK